METRGRRSGKRVALVTGGSRGLGLDMALALSSRGMRVAICARQTEALRRAEQALKRHGHPVLCIQADVTDPDAGERVVREVASKWRRLDILVNNCGGHPTRGRFLELTDQDWLDVFNLNVMTVVRFCRAAVPHLRESACPRIINISSVVAQQPGAYNPHYSSAKCAVTHLSTHLSRVLAADGILVNAISPGIIDTDGWRQYIQEKAAELGSSVPEVRAQEHRRAVAQIPLSRIGDGEEVAALVAFLASDEASYITGASLTVDGGKGVGSALGGQGAQPVG
jgi:NAD(P)-dependent dehydrogenase (short-subunit alcohol dehydrogenase family)